MSEKLSLLPLFILLSCPAYTFATTDSKDFDVTATINAICSISVTNLGFGAYDPSNSTPTNGTSSVNVTCTNGTTYTVGLGQGVNYARVPIEWPVVPIG